MSNAAFYTLVLKQLAPDAGRAGAEFADLRREGIGAAELRRVLGALAKVAPTVEFPLRPEIRISDGAREFLVQVKEGRLQLAGWTVPAGFSDGSADGIWAAIAGETAEVEPAAAAGDSGGGAGRRNRPALVASLVFLIVAANGFTAWWLGQPAPTLQPAYRLLEEDPARRLLERVAGVYETGRAEGDRRLRLGRDGNAIWSKYGAAGALGEETALTVAAAEAAGLPALRVRDGSLIEVRDPLTLVYFGDSYRRVQP